MKLPLALIVFAATPATAQLTPVAEPAWQAAPPPAPVWNPAASYVTAGQDEPGYRNWVLASPRHMAAVNGFNNYLTTWGVGGVVPTWQLIRTATMWRQCRGMPFEVPPIAEWPNVVQTLRYVRDYVIPAVGPVEPVSAYRNPSLNACAGGAPASSHQHFQAVDLVPLTPTSREDLMNRMCRVQLRRGSPYQVGLGFYAYLRFHIDTAKFRKWGAAASNEAQSCATPLSSTLAKGATPRAVPQQPPAVVDASAAPIANTALEPAIESPMPTVGQADPLAPR